jgi:hypothetical protein
MQYAFSGGTLALPNGTLPSDMLILYVIAAGTFTPPSGWNVVKEFAWQGAYAPYHTYVLSRSANGMSAGVTINSAPGGTAILFAYQNVNSVVADGVATFAQSTDSAISVAALAITTQANSLILGFGTDRTSNGDVNYLGIPSGYTTRADVFGQYFIVNASERVSSAGSTGQPAWSHTAQYPATAFLIELRP